MSFGHPNIHIFCVQVLLQWHEKELDTQFTKYFWTPNSEILANALKGGCINCPNGELEMGAQYIFYIELMNSHLKPMDSFGMW